MVADIFAIEERKGRSALRSTSNVNATQAAAETVVPVALSDLFSFDADIFAADYARPEIDIFRYTDPVAGGHRWHLQHEIANRAAALAAPKPPEVPHIPHISPIVEHIAGITEGLKPSVAMPPPVAMPSAAQVTLEPKPKPVKPPKPPKPVPTPPPVLSKPNPLGFHESTIKKALETFQNPSGKGTREQLLSHLGKHQGASQEAELTGLNDWLKDKPNVSREDVLKHLAETPHKVRMEEHWLDDRSPKWKVLGDDGDNGEEYESQEAAQQHADYLNDEARERYAEDFSIEGGEAKYTINTPILEDLEEKETELGGEITLEASRALTRLGRNDFDSRDEAQDAINEYIHEHLPKLEESGTLGDWEDDDPMIEESPGGYVVANSPLSHSRHQRYFGDHTYDTEEEAKDAINEYLDHHFEAPYSAVETDPEAEQETYEEWSLDGPKENYNETHVAMPGIRGPQKPLLKPEDLTTKSMRSGTISVFNNQGHELEEYEPDAGSPGIDDVEFWKDQAAAAANRTIANANARSQISWKDGHGNFQHIDNPVVRIRHDDRETTDGKKMFFVEEIQGPSDTNQEEMPKWVQDRIYDIGLKRALMKAVQGGYARMGFTTGDQQADRYNLAKAVDRIEWKPTSPMHEGIQSGHLVGIKDGKEVGNWSLVNSELPEYVGKEVAEKMLGNAPQQQIKPGAINYATLRPTVVDGEGIPVREFVNVADAQNFLAENQKSLERPSKEFVHSVEGPDLSVGGRGLKELYDRELHKRLLEIKIGDKKLKAMGVKIGTSEIPNGEFEIVQDGEVVSTHNNRRDAELALSGFKARNPGESASVVASADEVHSIDIPPELAAEIKRHGVSLYRRRGEPLQFDRAMMEIVRKLPASEAVVYALGVLRLLDLRPSLMLTYTTEELSYLRAIVQQVMGNRS